LFVHSRSFGDGVYPRAGKSFSGKFGCGCIQDFAFGAISVPNSLFL